MFQVPAIPRFIETMVRDSLPAFRTHDVPLKQAVFHAPSDRSRRQELDENHEHHLVRDRVCPDPHVHVGEIDHYALHDICGGRREFRVLAVFPEAARMGDPGEINAV